MASTVDYFVTYPCPQCKLELEAEHGGWQGWLRCPACGHPSLPPDILFGHPAALRRLEDEGDDGPSFVMTDAEEPGRLAAPVPLDRIDEPPSAITNSLGLLFLTGLVIALFILLISFLDDNPIVTGSSAVAALTFFLLMLRLPGRRRRRT